MSSWSNRKTPKKSREGRERKTITENTERLSKFLNLTMIRPCEIHWQLIRVEKVYVCIWICPGYLSFRSRLIRAEIPTNLGNLLTDIASQNKYMKRNFHSDKSAIHCWSLVASLPVSFLTCSPTRSFAYFLTCFLACLLISCLLVSLLVFSLTRPPTFLFAC